MKTPALLLLALSGLALTAAAAESTVPANLRALATADGAIVALTTGGDLQRSADQGNVFVTTRTATADALATVAARGATAIAAGDAGFIVRSADSGQTWSAATAPAFNGELLAAASRGGSFWVAVGRRSLNVTALWSADDGRTWTLGTLPALAGTLRGVAYDASAARWTAVGTDGLLGARLLTSADGLTWTAATVPPGTPGLTAVAADGSGHLLAVGEQGTLLTSADGGQNFAADPQSQTLVTEDLTAVLHTGTAWTVGGAESVRLAVTAGGAGSVTQAPVPGTAATTALALTSGGDVLAGGAYAPVTPPAAPGRLINLSIRTQAGAGSDTLIVGFVTGPGAGGASVLVRAGGPFLSPYGVTGVMADPGLAVNGSAGLLAANTDWSAGLLPYFTHVGAAPWTAGSKDAALALELASGAYTAVITGQDGGSGVALGEIYDLTTTWVATKSALTNASARSQVGTGDNILIAGFVITGDAPLRVLVRAVGPTLGDYGVQGALQDPVLTLYQGSTAIAANDNWSASLSPTFTQVGAFALPPDSHDAALVADLPPGVYTAQVQGQASSTGVALAEIYAVPNP